jgi:hypothetical protein
VNIRGLGDRWLAGEPVPGVAFARNDSVSILGGPYAKENGVVVMLLDVRSEPVYLIALGAGGGDVRVRQSGLRAVE